MQDILIELPESVTLNATTTYTRKRMIIIKE